jgi:hypothetical protein
LLLQGEALPAASVALAEKVVVALAVKATPVNV